jgi:hypothetical protein
MKKKTNKMKISRNEEGSITVNGQSFLAFAAKFRGKKFINGNGFHVYKYEVFWRGLSESKIKKEYIIVDLD